MIETYLVGPLILVLVVLVAAMLDRWSVPVILVALGTGILFGSDLLGWWDFSDVALANQIANLALVFILFQGGFSTKRESLRHVLLPAGGLATWGVAITALATTLVLWGVLHWPLEKAVLLGAIISSTDSAATFSILRHHPIRPRLATTVQMESAANDPMAIVLTLSVMEFLTAPDPRWHLAIPWIVWKFAAGIAIGALLGRAAVWLFNRLKPQDRGHYYVLTTGLVLLIYGLAELAHSSAMLAVFVAGYIMGNRPFVHRQGVANFVSALASIAETGMFAMMGLLVYPRQWAGLWLEGVLLFLVLTFVARPAAVWLGTAGMRLGTRQRVFISWAGLRGAVPIILATYPLAAGLPVGQEVLNLVYFAVILSIAFQGSTLGWMARCLKLCSQPHPRPLHSLELVTMAQSDMDLIAVDMPGPQGSPGPLISELCLPAGAAIALVSRGSEVVAPKGATRLLGWDQVTILARAADEPAVRAAVLGQAESRGS